MSAWRSFLVYMGGLTFDSAEPSKFLKIPNLVAAKRFGTALLDRLGLYQSMGKALHTLAQTGNPMDVLAGYCHLMRQRDVIGDAFAKKEEHHRDSILITILENPAIKPVAEYEVVKVRSLLIYHTNQREADLNSVLRMTRGLSICSLRTTRTSILLSSSRTFKSPTWDSMERISPTKRNSSRPWG
jgi:hypothetical protein